MKVEPYCSQLQKLENRVQKLEKQAQENDRIKGPLTKTLVEYGGSTTIHGLPYILEDGRLLLERVLWVVLVTLGAILSLISTYGIYKDWDENPEKPYFCESQKRLIIWKYSVRCYYHAVDGAYLPNSLTS